MRTRTILGLAQTLVGGCLLSSACGGPPSSDIALDMLAPAGVLDEASGVQLFVFPSEGRSCTAEGGASEKPSDALSFSMAKTGCEGGATWCTELSLERDSTEYIFNVEVTGPAGILAQGCSTARIDQDPVEVDIRVLRFVAPACCGDGILQATELCDTGPAGGACGEITADGICTADCSTQAIPVDFTTNSPGAIGQGGLSMVVASGAGELEGAVRAVWENTSADNSDVGVRYLRPDTSSLTSPPGFDQPHRLLLECDGTDAPLTRNQRSPVIAATGSTAVIAFRTNLADPFRYDLSLTELGANGCSNAMPLSVSDGAAEVVSLDVGLGAGPTALVVWEQNGEILSRTYAVGTGVLGTITPIASGSAPRVAATASGWTVVYRANDAGDDDGIFVRAISSAGAPSAARLVNAQTAGPQDQPDIFVLPDGRYAVAWRNAGDVYVQRFAQNDTPVSGDQDNPVHLNRDGEQAAPALAGSGSFFVVAFESGSELRARLLGADAEFLPNNVTGQNDDFVISAGAVAPKRPAAVVGAYLIFGWEDQGGAAPGMYVRRFPVPT